LAASLIVFVSVRGNSLDALVLKSRRREAWQVARERGCRCSGSRERFGRTETEFTTKAQRGRRGCGGVAIAP
jgi:hypothetical protein